MSGYLNRIKGKFASSSGARNIKSAPEADLAEALVQRLGGVGGDADKLLIRGGEAGLADGQTALRFLRAEKQDLDKAAKRLQAYAQWRADVCPFRCITEKEVANEIAGGKVFLGKGTDAEGRPLVVAMGSRHFANKRDLEEIKRFTFYTLDTAIAKIDTSRNIDGKFCIIADMRGVGYSNLDTGMLRQVFVVLQSYYPERMDTLWFYDAPTMFWSVWKLVTPFIDPVTRAKVKFVFTSDGSYADITQRFSKQDLPKKYGGEADLIPIHEHGLSPPASRGKGHLDAEHHHTIPLAVDVVADLPDEAAVEALASKPEGVTVAAG